MEKRWNYIMAKQDVKKVYGNSIIDLEEMVILEHNKDGDLVGTFSLQAILEDIANSGHVEFGISYKSSITPDED